MTAAVRSDITSEVLAPIRATLQAAFGAEGPPSGRERHGPPSGRERHGPPSGRERHGPPSGWERQALPGLAPGLVVPEAAPGWVPATAFVDGSRLPELLDAAKHRWRAAPHAAAALAWKAYTYWVALPPVLGWASARRVPLMYPSDVLVHFEDHRPLLTLGVRRSVRVAVLPSDPLALAGAPGVQVVPDEAALLGALRGSLLDAHLAPLLARIRDHVRLGSRTLLGSLASGVSYGVLRAADVLPGSATATVETLLSALGVVDLVDLVPGADGRPAVQRKTCCLAFTLPEPKICSGCCIRPT